MQKTSKKFIDSTHMGLYFDYLGRCRGVEQMEKHHPEGDVLNHSLQCLYMAFRESSDIDLVLAAMLHDIGKIENSKGHEKIAIDWLSNICSVKTLWLIHHHMRVWDLLLGRMKRKGKINELIGHAWLPELIHLARLDKMSRNQNKTMEIDKHDIATRINVCCVNHFKETK